MTLEEWDKGQASLADLLYESGLEPEEAGHKAVNYMNTNYGPRPVEVPERVTFGPVSFSINEFNIVVVDTQYDDEGFSEGQFRSFYKQLGDFIKFFDTHAEV